MANLALIRGEADVAPKFLDVGKAFSEPFANVVGKAVEFREQQKAIVKRENEIRAQEYASIDTVDVSQIGEDLLGATTVEANNIKNKAFELIKNKSNMDPVEYSIALSNLKKDVADLNANIKIKKLLGTDYADADKIGQAPWLDANNKAALLAAIDTNVKKDWVKKDGKYFLTTDGGKTLIDLSNIKPPETIDYGIGVAIENSTQQMLQNKYKLGQTLTDQNVIDTADLQIRSMNPSQIKSAALHFNVAGNTEESQRDYYNKSLDEITEDVRNAMVSRLKGIQSSLNTKLSQANTPKLSAPELKYRRENFEKQKNINDFTTKFARAVEEMYGLERNKAGVITGGQFQNKKVNTKSKEFEKLINRMGYSLGDMIVGESSALDPETGQPLEDYKGTQIIKQGTNKKYEILENESLENILASLVEAEVGDIQSAEFAKELLKDIQNIITVKGGFMEPTPEELKLLEQQAIADEMIRKHSTQNK